MRAPDVSPEFIALQSTVAGRYSLVRELGRGGMGIVFLARDAALDRPVAIKLLPPLLARSPAMHERFLREARTAAKLSHPHIVAIHAVESHEDLAFFVMAWIDGETLGERVRRAGPLPPRDVMRLTQEVAWALGHAHAHGVVHRDVKPDNILLERGSGRALVTDFGIARLAEGTDTPSRGTVTGTPRWMSPEQASGGEIDSRSDIYSLGLTAYFALTGVHPFEAPTMLALRSRQMTESVPALVEACPTAPIALARAVERALTPDPAGRFASADEFAEALRAARGAETAIAAPVRRFVADAEAAGGEIGTALTAAVVSLGVFHGLGVVELALARAFSGAAYYSVAAIAAGLAGVRVGQLIDRARHLLRVGYGHEAVRPALALAERDRAEDRLVAPVQRRGATRETWLLGALGAAKTALAIVLYTASGLPGVVQALGFVGSVVIPAVTLRKIWSDLRRDRPSVWNRILAGRAGRGIFRVAGLGLGARAQAIPGAGEPTVLAVGRDAEALYAALPPEQRERLGDVPRLIERLETDALALRARGDNAESAERLATIVAALEVLRLDLLRLRAGTATLDDLTADLEAARRVREEIDARLSARRDVERLLEDSPTPA